MATNKSGGSSTSSSSSNTNKQQQSKAVENFAKQRDIVRRTEETRQQAQAQTKNKVTAQAVYGNVNGERQVVGYAASAVKEGQEGSKNPQLNVWKSTTSGGFMGVISPTNSVSFNTPSTTRSGQTTQTTYAESPGFTQQPVQSTKTSIFPTTFSQLTNTPSAAQRFQGMSYDPDKAAGKTTTIKMQQRTPPPMSIDKSQATETAGVIGFGGISYGVGVREKVEAAGAWISNKMNGQYGNVSILDVGKQKLPKTTKVVETAGIVAGASVIPGALPAAITMSRNYVLAEYALATSYVGSKWMEYETRGKGNKKEFFTNLGLEIGGSLTGGLIATGRTPVRSYEFKAGDQTIKGITLEAAGKAQPVISIKDNKFILGTPKVEFKPGFEKVVYETPTQTKIFRNSLPETVSAQEVKGFEAGYYVTGKTQTTSSSFIQEKFTRDINSLSREGVEGYLDYAKGRKKDIESLYGSFSAEAQMKNSRKIADIDTQLKLGEVGTSEYVQGALIAVRNKGKDIVRISKQSPNLIESYKGGKWVHALDIHSISDALRDVSSPAVAGDMIYGRKLGQRPIKIEGLPAMKLSEQGLRKFASTYTLREIPTVKGRKGISFGPEAHRLKDIPDYFATQQTLIESKWFGKKKLQLKLEEQKSTFPKELTEKKGTIRLEYPLESKTRLSSLSSISKPISISSLGIGSISVSSSISKLISAGSIASLPISPSPSKPISPSPSKPISPSKPLSPSSISKSIGSISPSPSPSPSPSMSYYENYIQPIPPFIPPFIPLPSGMLFGNGKKGKGSKSKRPAKYTPSLVAIALNIRGKKPKYYSGLSIRPIISSGRSKRKTRIRI